MPSARKPAKKMSKPARKSSARKQAAQARKVSARKQTKPTKRTEARKGPTGKEAAAKKAPAKRMPAKKKAASEEQTTAKRKTPAKKRAPTRAKAPAKKAPAKKAPPRKRARQVTCPLSGLLVTPGAPRLGKTTLRRLRGLLTQERERHLHQAEDLQAEADELATERDPGDTQFDEESGEGDTLSVERERSLLLSASARHAVEEIDRALARMDAGTYGVCVPAGRPINLDRLEAIPWAETCVECAQRVARRR